MSPKFIALPCEAVSKESITSAIVPDEGVLVLPEKITDLVFESALEASPLATDKSPKSVALPLVDISIKSITSLWLGAIPPEYVPLTPLVVPCGAPFLPVVKLPKLVELPKVANINVSKRSESPLPEEVTAFTSLPDPLVVLPCAVDKSPKSAALPFVAKWI